jgi:hypothetical protein
LLSEETYVCDILIYRNMYVIMVADIVV